MLVATCGLAVDDVCTVGADIMVNTITSEKMTASPEINTLWLSFFSRLVLFTEKIRELDIYDFLIS